MKNNQLKEKIALELNMQFDEAVDLFSEETLNSMRMKKVAGGENITITSLNAIICIKDKCTCTDGMVETECIPYPSPWKPTIEMPTLEKPTCGAPT